MPRLDSCHQQVVNALIKDGWLVKSSQFFRFGRRGIFIDIVGIRHETTEQEILFIEVKCFPNRDNIFPDLHEAIGQYLDYANLLELAGYPYPLYLVIPLAVFRKLDGAAQHLFERNHINLLIIDISGEEIIQWIQWQSI